MAGKPNSRSTWNDVQLAIVSIVLALTLLLCCALVVGVIMIDQTKSWCSIPMIGPLVGCP